MLGCGGAQSPDAGGLSAAGGGARPWGQSRSPQALIEDRGGSRIVAARTPDTAHMKVVKGSHLHCYWIHSRYRRTVPHKYLSHLLFQCVLLARHIRRYVRRYALESEVHKRKAKVQVMYPAELFRRFNLNSSATSSHRRCEEFSSPSREGRCRRPDLLSVAIGRFQARKTTDDRYRGSAILCYWNSRLCSTFRSLEEQQIQPGSRATWHVTREARNPPDQCPPRQDLSLAVR